MSSEDPEHPVVYKVVVSEAAEALIAEAFDRLFLRNPNLGLDWLDQLNEGLSSLSEFPRRYPTASNQGRSLADIRSFVNRYKGIAYRVTYAIIEPIDGDPLVRILRVRHATREE